MHSRVLNSWFVVAGRAKVALIAPPSWILHLLSLRGVWMMGRGERHINNRLVVPHFAYLTSIARRRFTSIPKRADVDARVCTWKPCSTNPRRPREEQTEANFVKSA